MVENTIDIYQMKANLEDEGLFPPVRIFLNLFLRAGYFFNAFD